MTVGDIERALLDFDHQFAGGVGEAEIAATERSIDLPFPPSYREFLERFGSGFVSFEEFIGLGGPDHLDVARETIHLRNHSRVSRFPDHFIPVRTDGFGNYDCIDTASRSEGGECPVVAWLHDGGDEQSCEHLADSYWDWFRSILEMIRHVDAQKS